MHITPMFTRQPYHGLQRKLVLAFDVGTTYSGVSYSILYPGRVPTTQGVTRFPSQEAPGGGSKIPSVLYYDKEGNVRAVGAEALQEHIIEEAEDEEWIKVEWFKLHLRPTKTTKDSEEKDGDSAEELPPLPPNKTVVTVFADFLKYLYRCTQNYIQETHANGSELWKSVEGNINFILSHPNGWEGPQQGQMRQAAVLAGLVPDTQDGHGRIQFVTEGEASLHFCIGNGLASEVTENGQGVIIVDAGGGTIDLSAYAKVDSSFEESAPAECLFQGSVYVSRRAETFLQKKLESSAFGSPEDIRNMTSIFDKTTKLKFKSLEEPSYIKFGTARDKDLSVGIRVGQLKLQGAEVAALFEPSVKSIIEAVQKQRQVSQKPVSAVFLVGGFAASNWLFLQLQNGLKPLGLSLCRPDSHVNKAVADGAISFYVDHFVSARVSKFTYGTSCFRDFNAENLDHQTRAQRVQLGLSGESVLPNAFDVILSKGTRVSETKEFRSTYVIDRNSLRTANVISSKLFCYRGDSPSPRWIDDEPDMYSNMCTVDADTSKMMKSLQPRVGRDGATYWRQEFDVILMFGLTEVKAQIGWMEDGREQRSPATIVFDEST